MSARRSFVNHKRVVCGRDAGKRELTVIRQRPAVLKLLPGKDQSLLVRRNSLLVLNLRLDIVDGVQGLNLESDGLAGKAGHHDRSVSDRQGGGGVLTSSQRFA